MNAMKECNTLHLDEVQLCPKCRKPRAVLRGLDAECKPIVMFTHRVSPTLVGYRR